MPSLYEVVQNINTKSWSSNISSATFIPAKGVTVKKNQIQIQVYLEVPHLKDFFNLYQSH